MVSHESILANRIPAYLVILLLSSAITPDWSPAPILILSGALILLFELAMFVFRRSSRKLSA